MLVKAYKEEMQTRFVRCDYEKKWNATRLARSSFGTPTAGLTMKDLCGFTGSFRWEIVGKTYATSAAELLHQQGRQAGGVGD
jgi:hypothetical protein